MTPTSSRTSAFTVSVIVPVHNEELGLHELYKRLDFATKGTCCAWHFLFVNDGSSDASLDVLQRLKARDSRVGIVNLSRCFGKEYAVSAGLAHAEGEAVVVMDADLQDPPECLPAMVDAWISGYDVVAMKRSDRRVDSWAKRQSARLFYALMQKLSDIDVPAEVGDFRLMSRRVVDVINSLPESNRCLKGLFAWAGFEATILEYIREERSEGESKWPIYKLIRLAVDGITAYSIAPLRVATVTGAITAVMAFLFGIFTFLKTIMVGDPVQGFTTLLTLITFLGGIQLIAIGVLGEYVGRTFMEVKRRPLFVVESVSPPTSGPVVTRETRLKRFEAV